MLLGRVLYQLSTINVDPRFRINYGIKDEENYKRLEKTTKVIYIISEYIRKIIAIVLTLIILGTIVYTAIIEKRFYLLPVALVPFVIMIFIIIKKIKGKK